MNHVFDIEHAQQYGLAEAVMISNFQFWISKNRANKENHREGRTWTYNSIKAFTDLFPYLSVGQIRRTLDRLVELKVLVTGTFNERAVDRTKWYAFFDECVFLPQQKHLSESANASVDSDKSLYRTDVNTDVNTDTAPAKQAVARPAATSGGKPKTGTLPQKFDPEPALVAAGVPPEKVVEWLAIRKDKRMAMSPSVIAHTEAEAAKVGLSLVEAVALCCAKGWGGFESRYVDPRGAITGASPAGPAGRPGPFEQSMGAAARAKEKIFGRGGHAGS